MLATALAVPLWFELLATVVYAISGSLSAVRARYDIFGTVCMAIVVGLLGGVLRLIHQVCDRVVQRLQRFIKARAVRQIALCLR